MVGSDDGEAPRLALVDCTRDRDRPRLVPGGRACAPRRATGSSSTTRRSSASSASRASSVASPGSPATRCGPRRAGSGWSTPPPRPRPTSWPAPGPRSRWLSSPRDGSRRSPARSRPGSCAAARAADVGARAEAGRRSRCGPRSTAPRKRCSSPPRRPAARIRSSPAAASTAPGAISRPSSSSTASTRCWPGSARRGLRTAMSAAPGRAPVEHFERLAREHPRTPGTTRRAPTSRRSTGDARAPAGADRLGARARLLGRRLHGDARPAVRRPARRRLQPDGAGARPRAARRDRPTVELRRATLPEETPAGPFSTIVCSEILYYWSPGLVRDGLRRIEVGPGPGRHHGRRPLARTGSAPRARRRRRPRDPPRPRPSCTIAAARATEDYLLDSWRRVDDER